MSGTPLFASASATFWMAVICGTPTPATMRVVQIEPGPIPTLTPSAPCSTSALANADRGADPQLALRVLAGVGVLALLQDVLHGDEPLQTELLVDHQHAL